MLLPKRGFYHPIAILVLAAITLSFAIIFYLNSSVFFKAPEQAQTPTTTSSPSPLIQKSPVDETANWKTYTNKQIGIRVQYPSNYQVKESTASVAFYIPNPKKSNWGVVIDEGFKLTVQPLKTKIATFESEADQYFYPGLGKLNLPQKTSNMKLDGTDAIRSGNKQKVESLPEDIASVFTIKNNKTYLFTLITSEENRVSLIKTFDQILSTFQFLD